MQIANYVEELQRQLVVAAAAGGAEAQEVAERLTAALDAAARLAFFEALSDAAGEITRELAPGSVDVRLRGREVEFVVSKPAAEPVVSSASSTPNEPVEDEDGTTSRTTLRLPDSLKTRAEAAAATQGISLNTWFVRAVGAALEPRRPMPPSHGSSYTGWVR
ncbi:toxin-antitoxin system HicB family antitoxin [Solirubrobacter sp. CPCC 204708]|uniref:Type II toxin-antitoxin system HicB family antitoxin n=1 Tax=Solirubrobacter deserti TaxID=2282478 RepID=A0ABT4RRU6_9ACTN|nr:toxin-antitoxin system HicB family antitoxin [Solirubrobacter deserti]MBE2318718.1 toxin-antitoxin system HicB family antitoxin [Solirubrobacter deserti]MDA0141308.1 type II toxin-antitoxin system HicB family antitoxin [Solirubrobacter deserti]